MNTTENILDEIAAAEAEWDTSPSAPTEVAFNTDNTDASDIIAMDEDNEDRSVNGNECHSDQVALVGRDGTEVWCSRTRVFEQSGKLSEMISDQQDSEARIHLPVSSSEAILLARGIDADISGWESYTLEELVRAANLFYNYDLRQWHVGLESAILDCLRRPEDDTFAKLRDQRFADKLVYTANQGSMSLLLSYIHEQGFSSTVNYVPGDDRPRKRRKVCTGAVHHCIPFP